MIRIHAFFAAACLARAAWAVSLSQPSFSSGQIQFSFDSASDQLLSVQIANATASEWTNVVFYRGTGNPITFTAPALGSQRFYRVRVTAFESLNLSPNAPTLSGGAITLPDATQGEIYSAEISSAGTGVPPYTLQTAGSLPDGVALSTNNNGTAVASIKLLSTATPSIQRRQFSVTITDAAGTSVTRAFDLRVIPPPPLITTSFLLHKTGALTDLTMEATNGIGPLAWQIISSPFPDGLILNSAGRLRGIPNADASELNETGLYTNLVKVTDSLTDRVTGAPTPRSSTNTILQLVRLSYFQNIWSDRSRGPNLQNRCPVCHNSNFTPEITESPLTISGKTSQSIFYCPDQTYLVPGSPEVSLIYKKLSAPDCGARMPKDGPYFEDDQLARVQRWIRELGFSDDD